MVLVASIATALASEAIYAAHLHKQERQREQEREEERQCWRERVERRGKGGGAASIGPGNQ